MKLWTPDLASGGQKYTCAKCGLKPTPEEHDGCLGTLPGSIMNACCGHGDDRLAYIQYEDSPDVRGVDAIKEQERIMGIEQYMFRAWRRGTKLKDILAHNRTWTPKMVSDAMHKITEEFWSGNI